MFAVLNRISLPLVVKELLEQAARRRTYIIRVAYASLFFLACLLIILSEMPRGGSSPFGVLGIGHTMFISIAGWQFAGIYLFLPAMACSVLTVEKERNTLGLLFLTKLGPWTIIIEKLLSRLLPMYCLILCSLPLLAFSMSFGGVNTIDFFIAVWFLSLTAFQICALAVACSSVFRTTTGALLMCYLVMFVMGFGIPISDWLIFDRGISRFLETNFGILGQYDEVAMFSFVGFVGFIVQVESSPMGFMGPWQTLYFNLLMAIPLVGSGVVYLMIGRICLYRRAFVAASNPVLKILKSIDGLFHKLNNNRVTRGIVVLKEGATDPGFSPIAWRETQKRSLGQVRYLVRILLALEIPVLFTICGVVIQARDAEFGGGALSVTTMLVWLVSTLLITVTSAGLISGERGRQTLEILLALPMSGREIILDKLAGVRRVAFVCAIPLLTCITFQTWWVETAVVHYGRYGGLHLWWDDYLTKLSMVAIYIPLLIWLGLWIGLKIKSPTRATSAALIAVAAWCVLPLIMICTVWALFTNADPVRHIGLLLQTSPAFLLFYVEFDSLHRLASIPLLPMIVNILIYGSCTLVLRSWVLSYADQLLGRTLPRKPAILWNDWDNESGEPGNFDSLTAATHYDDSND